MLRWCAVGCSNDAMDADNEMLSVRLGTERSAVDHELQVVRRKARLIAAAEQALTRASRQTHHYGTNVIINLFG